MSSYRSVPIFGVRELRRPRSVAVECIFTALDEASWADVRRVAAADPFSLTSTKSIGLSRPLYPLDYALHLVADCSAVLDHCDRTGVPNSLWSTRGGVQLTLRGRLSALSHICVLMTTSSDFQTLPPPKDTALHLALQARLAPLSLALLQRYPHLAAVRTAQSGKTPLHTLASSVGSSAPSSWLASSIVIAQAILRCPSVFATDLDVDGRSALHDLCSGLSASSHAYGLFGLIPRSRASLRGVAPLVKLLIAHGAFPCQRDNHGETPVGIAVKTLDYTTLLIAADEIMQKISGASSSVALRSSAVENVRVMPHSLLSLPEDVLRLVISKGSPRDALCGVGTCCHELRRISVSNDLWQKSLAIPFTGAHARACKAHDSRSAVR
jgi:hypothetical protein